MIILRTQVSSKKEEKKPEKPSEKDGKDAKKPDSKSNKSDTIFNSGADASKKDERKHGRMLTFLIKVLQAINFCDC